MTHDTAFLGACTSLGQYWTKRRKFDYLINKENFQLTFGRSFRMMVYLDNAIANGPCLVRQDVEADTRATNYMVRHLGDIKPELTVFVTTCDMLPYGADENTPPLEHSSDPYVENRIRLYHALNLQYGRVLNVHVPEVASPSTRGYSHLIDTLMDPPPSGELPLASGEWHQLYFLQKIMADVERCIPLGIPSIIASPPPLATREIVEALAPHLLDRLAPSRPEDNRGMNYTSIHSFQWLDPRDGYLLSKEDQLALLRFFFKKEV